MSTARDGILGNIRRSLKRGPVGGAALDEVRARLATPPRGPEVKRARLPQPEKVDLFCHWAWKVPPGCGAGKSRKRVQPPASGRLP